MAKMPAPPRPNPPPKPGMYDHLPDSHQEEEVPGWNSCSIKQLNESEYSVSFAGYSLTYNAKTQAKSLLLEASSKVEDCNTLDGLHSISTIRMEKVIKFMTFLNDVAMQKTISGDHLMMTLLKICEETEDLQAAFIAELRKKCSRPCHSKGGK